MIRRAPFTLTLFTVALLLLADRPSYAQFESASVLRTVRDASKATLPSAEQRLGVLGVPIRNPFTRRGLR